MDHSEGLRLLIKSGDKTPFNILKIMKARQSFLTSATVEDTFGNIMINSGGNAGSGWFNDQDLLVVILIKFRL